jgi:hypothetical protein
MAVRTLIGAATKDGGSFSGSIMRVTNDKMLTGTANPIDVYQTSDAMLTGSVRLLLKDGYGFKMPDLSSMATTSTNQLLHLTAAILLGAIVIAGLSAFIHSRVAARKTISQN